jgi:hypothetical protein
VALRPIQCDGDGVKCGTPGSLVSYTLTKEPLVKACSDLLAAYQRKCARALAGMVTWRLSTCRMVMKSLYVGTGHNPM